MPFDQAAIRAAVLESLRNEPPAQTQAISAPDHVGPWPYVAAIAGPVADAATTLDAFSRGGVEGNALLGQHRAAMLGTKAAQAILVPLLMKKLADDGHGTAAKTLGYLTGGISGSIAAHNATVNR